MAAITDYHKFGDFEQQRFTLSAREACGLKSGRAVLLLKALREVPSLPPPAPGDPPLPGCVAVSL